MFCHILFHFTHTQGIIVQPMYIGKSFNLENQFWKIFFKDGFLFSYLLTFYGVCSTVLLIALDRFLATYLMSRYKQFVTFKKTICAISLTWLYIGGLCALPFLPKTRNSTAWRNISAVAAINATSTEDMYLPSQAKVKRATSTGFHGHFYCPQAEWTVFMLICNVAVPYVVIVFCYVYILRRLKQLEANIRLAGEANTEESKQEVEAPFLRHGDKQIHSAMSSLFDPMFHIISHLVLPFQQTHQVKSMDKIQKSRAGGFKSNTDLTSFTLGLLFIYFLLWTPSVIYYTLLSLYSHVFPVDWDNSPAEKRIVFVLKMLSYVCGLLSPLFYTRRNHEMKQFLRTSIRSKLRMLRSNDNLGRPL